MSLSLQLVSPDSKYFEGVVQMVVLPGIEGDFSVLAEHAPLITYLRPGQIIILEEKNKEHIYFVGSGFVKVENNNCNVLVDNIQKSTDLDLGVSKKELAEVLTEIDNENNNVEIKGLLEKKQILEEQINFLENTS